MDAKQLLQKKLNALRLEVDGSIVDSLQESINEVLQLTAAVPDIAQLRSQGILPRYIVSKADGSPMDPGAEYFVLRLDDGGDDKLHVLACRDAVLMYATMIQEHLPVLSKELFEKYGVPSFYRYLGKNFHEDLALLINKYSLENYSNTPDFILASYLEQCLIAFNNASTTREDWYGTRLSPGKGKTKQEGDEAVRAHLM